MGAGFIRRFEYQPSQEELLAIEGAVIIDTPPPSSIKGVGTGVVFVVGEAADCSYACFVDSSGIVQSSLQPVEVLSGVDLLDKIGGFDSSIGEFGGELGNLWCELRNKRFKRLIVCPVDTVRPSTGSQYAARFWRELPTNISGISPLPFTPVVGASVPAGADFYNGSNHIHLAQKIKFTATTPRGSGIDATTTITALPATTRTLVRATGSFIVDGVSEGDVIVVGAKSATADSQNEVCARTSIVRVVSVDSATTVTVQRMDGSNFVNPGVAAPSNNWEAGPALAFRIHRGTDADTGGVHQFSEAASFNTLVRPLTASITGPAALTPTVVAATHTATVWEPLSGLTGYVRSGGDITYEAAIHDMDGNAAAALNDRYRLALEAGLADEQPVNEVNIVFAARKNTTIRGHLYTHALAARANGLGRNICLAPELETNSTNTVVGTTNPGVGGSGAQRHRCLNYSWPGLLTLVPEAIGYSLPTSDSDVTDDGILDTGADGWLAAVLSNLNPEENPGQSGEPVTSVMSYVKGYAYSTPKLKLADYILLKQYGVCAPRYDRQEGFIFQSGVTTSLTTGEEAINRQRFSDFVQDSLARAYNKVSKKLARQTRLDALRTETEAFCAGLLSEDAPDLQRIKAFSIDDKGTNTEARQAKGIHVIVTKIQMLPDLKALVAQTEVSPDLSVDVTVS